MLANAAVRSQVAEHIAHSYPERLDLFVALNARRPILAGSPARASTPAARCNRWCSSHPASGATSMSINKTAGIIQVTERPSALKRVEAYLTGVRDSIHPAAVAGCSSLYGRKTPPRNKQPFRP
jgi:hypothetical protein